MAVARKSGAVETKLQVPSGIELVPISASQVETSKIADIVPDGQDQGTGTRGSADIADVSAILPTNSTPLIPNLSRLRATIIIGTVVCITLTNSMLSGILIISLPTMAVELNLDDSLLLWPASVSALASGCTLLISGSISDLVGGRKIYLLGCVLLTASTLACSRCHSGIELILYRAWNGIALSLCLPSSVQLITANIPTGTRRNIAFASLGAGQPVGFSIGLVLGGFFVQGVGWRYGYYIGAIITFAVFIISFFGLPKDRQTYIPVTWARLRTEIDWIGCLLLSTSLGLFSYVLSILTSGVSNFIAPVPPTLLAIAILLLPAFGVHVNRQERLSKPAVIPFSLFSNTHFMSLCLIVFLVWAVFNATQFFLTLFFQSVLQISPIETSLRFLPMVIIGALTNFVAGHLVSRVAANHLILISAAITAISPLLLATIDTTSSYWLATLWAVGLAPVCPDILFTVSNLIITQAFPYQMHGIAGGVFNTLSNIGNSVGLAVTAVIASTVTMAIHNDETSAEKLMSGYRAVFWTCFGFSVLILVIAGFGMRKIGKVGVKTD